MNESKNVGDLKDSKTLEEKTNFFDRLKYVALPLALTAGAYFTPEIQSKYSSLSEEDRQKYKKIALGAGFIVGSVITLSTGYKLVADYRSRNARERADVEE